MIAYNPYFLQNLEVQAKAKYWAARKLLSAEQLNAVLERYRADFYSPTIFIRIGLFLFTWFAISSAMGMCTTMFLIVSSNYSAGVMQFLLLLFSIGSFTALELFIANKNIYKAGTDDALLYSGIGFLLTFLGMTMENIIDEQNGILLFSILALPIFAAAVVRYADRLMALLLVLDVFSVFFQLVMKTGDIAKLIMPFALMALAALIYFSTRKFKSDGSLFFWKGCLTVFECISLLVFYAAGNYFVIRESGIEFFDMELAPGQDIPFSFLFYALTVLVPLAYIFYGLKQKDKTLLWTGLIVIAASALTFKHYFSLGHPEITLTLAGSVMIIVAYFSIRYLKTPQHGITYEEETDEDSFLKTNAEALVIAQSFSQQAQPQNDPKFGEGGFGGGGAGSKF